MSARFLLIDVSNSFTKLAFATDTALKGRVRRVATPGLTAAALHRSVGKPGRVDQLILSCVVPSALRAVETFAREIGAPLHVLDHRTPLGIGIDYPKPATIGADRLANAAGAALFYGAPCVVVDFGTAVTFDVLAGPRREPKYVGGVIAPGLEAMTHYLHQRTALLPRIDLREPRAAIGRSTREAMLSGAIYGYRGLVHGILRELRAQLGNPRRFTVVATGGYADLIAQRLPEIDHVHPNLTLEGLRIVGVQAGKPDLQ